MAKRFIERLSYTAGPSSRALPKSIFQGAPLREVIRLRWAWARSARRRAVQARRIPPVWNGTRAVKAFHG